MKSRLGYSCTKLVRLSHGLDMGRTRGFRKRCENSRKWCSQVDTLMTHQVHISELIPKPGERVLTAGRSRSGKSSLMDWTTREIQRSRPTCMQILIDTKPRFRAEKIPGPVSYRNRRHASQL